MARAIDADHLADGLKYHYQPTDQECDYDRQWAVGYNAGLNRALYSIAYARTIEPKQEWVSVKDRLPTGEDATGGFIIAIENDKERRVKPWPWDIVVKYANEFTHWMPLPEPPKED